MSLHFFVNAFDNYNDFHNANEEGHDYKQKTNVIGKQKITNKNALTVIITLFSIFTLLGLYLLINTGWPLLIMGGICAVIGYFYSGGPHPISHGPLGELLSGLTMGFMILLIGVYINIHDMFKWNFSTLGAIFLIALPSVCWIANVMLANNICDLEEDKINDRHTIVFYIGKQHSINLFVILNVIAFISVILSAILGIAPLAYLLTLLVVPFASKQIKLFKQKQIKTETFSCAVRILGIGSTTEVLSFLIGILL